MMTDRTEFLVSTLSDLIRIPSFSGGEEGTAGMLEDVLKTAGCKPRRWKNNVFATSEMTRDRPMILLNSHHDTVKPVKNWQRDPHTPVVEGDHIYGLGSNDAGGSLVCLLRAFLELKGNDLPFNLGFLASAEEEISGKDGVELALAHMETPEFAIVGEPTGMHPAIAEKGLVVIDAEAHGESGHAARDEGVNALYIAMEDIRRIRDFHDPRPSPLLGPVKMTVTQIRAGTQHNVIPESCSFVIDVRTNEYYSNQQVFELIDGMTQSTLTARSFRLNSSALAEGHPAVAILDRLGRKAYGSPTLSDQALMSFPSLKLGPGESARSHTADEYIRIPEMVEAVEIYTALLMKLKL